MNKDFKKILIYCACLLILSSILLNIRGCGHDFQELERQNQAIQNTRDSLKNANFVLKSEFDAIQKSVDERKRKINNLCLEIDSINRVANSYKKSAERAEKNLTETNKKIESLRKNPIKRNDDELIKSLKNKLKNT